MNRRRIEWIDAPDAEEGEPIEWLSFRVAGEWYATDAEKLYLPITVLASSAMEVQEPYPAMLAQYGGESLLNDLALNDEQPLEQGAEYRVSRSDGAGGRMFTVETLDEE